MPQVIQSFQQVVPGRRRLDNVSAQILKQKSIEDIVEGYKMVIMLVNSNAKQIKIFSPEEARTHVHDTSSAGL